MNRFSRILFLTAMATLTGCISVSLPKSESVKATNAVVSAPSDPFAGFSTDKADQAWTSQRTGNVISYYSECGGKSDLGLRDLLQESLGALEDARIDNQSTFDYNARVALRALVRGKADGVPMSMDQVLLKKNACVYILTYTGVEKNFASERARFERFIEGFKVP